VRRQQRVLRHYGVCAPRNLQPCGAKPRGRVVCVPAVHRHRGRLGGDLRAGGRPGHEPYPSRVPGLHQRAVRRGDSGPPGRAQQHAPGVTVRHRQALRVPNGAAVPRGPRPVRLQRHPVQPREPTSPRCAAPRLSPAKSRSTWAS
jgi:hypothetical protein